MAITIELQPEIERCLLARAQAQGVSLTDFAQEVLAREAGIVAPVRSPASEAKSLYDLFAPLRGLLTDDEVDQYFSRTPSSSRPVHLE